MGKIARIRQEIEQLRKLIDDHNYYLDNSEQALGYGLALDDIEKFLDTLSEEHDKNLEEAAEEYGKAQYGRKASLLPDRCRGCYAPIVYAFITGAEWQKSQMLKDAVETEVWNYSSDEDLRAIPLFGIDKFNNLKDGDKVRIVIIKEEEE